jgi:oligopeptidase A
MDIELHSPNYDPFGDKSIFELQHEMAPKYAVIPPLSDDRFLCSFGHIFAGGYSAGYYSYKWAGWLIEISVNCYCENSAVAPSVMMYG